MKQEIPGTIIFDGELAQKGLALNRMCFSFNDAENRAASCATKMAIVPNMALRRSSAGRCSTVMCWK